MIACGMPGAVNSIAQEPGAWLMLKCLLDTILIAVESIMQRNHIPAANTSGTKQPRHRSYSVGGAL